MDKLMHGGDLVRTRRENAGMTQARLAEKLGTSKSNISLMESGKRVIGRRMANRLVALFSMDDATDYMKVSTITPEEEDELRMMRKG
jgi:transcriptional regulator with XRE-family HTH domain